ncbi:hypothetical protein [Nostoc sp. ChiVER01]|uniref:hypothetical protein n=1 Tax=Nostoc sp. ChiVER01 TaxID=3075382 RepID=UPI002AD54D5C|nr:hypothetical protein [Nostoc sp. ChiVER01]MDZ8227563.1 hypothetical protein [Nostoc sp. ChiVER01]
MSTPEEQIKAAIVVYGDKIAIADPELNEATRLACYSLHRFVDYISTLDPKLERHQAITMASAILDSLPALLGTDSELIDGIKAECQALRSLANE